jgi:uncharacterized protein YgbK (DUF1537 family)
MKTRLLILADDLTGALDSGVQFAKRDIDVLVFPSPEAAGKQYIDNAAVMVINTSTRHASPEEARARVIAAAGVFTLGLKSDGTFFYKKTDSCLRGNIGAELEALLYATESARLPFVPAFPQLKRTTVKGYQYLDGMPIHQSSMARDPLNPITESFIPGIIGKQSAIPVRLLGITEQNSRIPEAQNHREILVFDAEIYNDLRNAARLLWEENLLKVSAGCAGFAEALMETLPLETTQKDGNFMPMETLPILIISGSLHNVSIEQVKVAQKEKVSCFGLPGDRLLQRGWLESKEAETLSVECSHALLKKGISILGTEASLGMTESVPHGSAQDISEALGEMVRKISEKAGPLHLVMFGGDTLLGMTKSLRYHYLRPLKEIQPGIVLAQTEGQRKGLLVTKSGAFGNKELILQLADFF